jgi:hypothetical protein
MGMGTFACHATTVSEEFISSLPTAGPILHRLLNLIEVNDIDDAVLSETRDDLHEDLAGENEELSKEIIALYNAIREAFHDDTGLYLCADYHDRENEGDRYDEVDGLYWEVSGVYEMTPAAKKIADHIQHVNFTKWG